jgi:hypothetical protein
VRRCSAASSIQAHRLTLEPDLFFIGDNSQKTLNTFHGAVIAGTATRFHFVACRSGDIVGTAGNPQAFGIVVNNGAADHYSIIGCSLGGNMSGGLFDGGTGTHKVILGNTPHLDVLLNELVINATGSDVDTAQPWLPSAGGVAVEAGGVWKASCTCRVPRASTATPPASLFGGTATARLLRGIAECKEGEDDLLAGASWVRFSSASAVVVKAASVDAAEQAVVSVTGLLVVNAAGTFIPQFQYSAAPGGAPSILAGSRFKLTRRRGNVLGTWS